MTVATFVLESTWVEDWDGAGAGESWTDEDAENALTWLTNIGSGAASGAATGAVAGPWGALIGGLVGGGLGAAQTALQQNQQAQRPPTPPAARPAPAPAPRPAPRPAPPPTRTIAVPRPAPTRPAPSPAAAPPAASVSAADVASLVTTLAPMLLALGQQLASTPSAPAGAALEASGEGWPDRPEDVDLWPVGDDVDPDESYGTPEATETYVEAAPEAYGETEGHEGYGGETESEAECWPPESDWQEVPT